MASIEDWVSSIHNAYVRGRPIALLFSYDGTLAPIVAHPDRADLPQSVRNNLCELTRLERMSIGIISGRSLTDLSARVGIDGIHYAGYGSGEVDLCGVRLNSAMSTALVDLLGVVENTIRDGLPRFPGIWIETRNRSFTIHYRGASPEIVRAFTAHFRQLMRGYRELRHFQCSEAIEVNPVDGWDQVAAVETILANLPENVLPVYFGSCENDLPGMSAVIESGGITVALGSTISHIALCEVESPAVLENDMARLSFTLQNMPAATKVTSPGLPYMAVTTQ